MNVKECPEKTELTISDVIMGLIVGIMWAPVWLLCGVFSIIGGNDSN